LHLRAAARRYGDKIVGAPCQIYSWWKN